MSALRRHLVGVAVKCAICGKVKVPKGRSAPLMHPYCEQWFCEGYNWAPFVGSLWPGESESDFGFPVSADGTTDDASDRQT
jgi:hypothetical protein